MFVRTVTTSLIGGPVGITTFRAVPRQSVREWTTTAAVDEIDGMFVRASSGITVETPAPTVSYPMDIFGDPAGREILDGLSEATLISHPDAHTVDVISKDEGGVRGRFDIKEDNPLPPEEPKEHDPQQTDNRPQSIGYYPPGSGSSDIKPI